MKQSRNRENNLELLSEIAVYEVSLGDTSNVTFQRHISGAILQVLFDVKDLDKCFLL